MTTTTTAVEIPMTTPPYPSRYAVMEDGVTPCWTCGQGGRGEALLDDLYARHVDALDREGWDVEQTPFTEIIEPLGTMRFAHILVKRAAPAVPALVEEVSP